MLFLVFFFLEIIIFFFISQLLTQKISNTLYKITQSKALSIGLYSIIFLPGTILHEMAHFIMATILFVPTGQIKFFPHLENEEIRLGSVAVAKTDPFRRLAIGIAPIILGINTILLSVLLFTKNITLTPLIKFSSIQAGSILLLFYILFAIGNTMFSSKKDMEGAAELSFVVFIITLSLYFLGIRIPQDFINSLFTQDVVEALKKTNIFVALPIALDLLLYLLLKSLPSSNHH